MGSRGQSRKQTDVYPKHQKKKSHHDPSNDEDSDEDYGRELLLALKAINKKIESKDPSIYGKPKKKKKGGGSFGREFGYYKKPTQSRPQQTIQRTET